MYHQEDSRIWILGTNEPASNRDATENKVGEREEDFEQCMLLVLNDLRLEHDLLFVCAVLRHCLR